MALNVLSKRMDRPTSQVNYNLMNLFFTGRKTFLPSSLIQKHSFSQVYHVYTPKSISSCHKLNVKIHAKMQGKVNNTCGFCFLLHVLAASTKGAFELISLIWKGHLDSRYMRSALSDNEWVLEKRMWCNLSEYIFNLLKNVPLCNMPSLFAGLHFRNCQNAWVAWKYIEN